MVGGGGWVGGVMTSMRMRLVFSFLDLVVLFGGAVQWWRGGGGVMTSMRMRLVFVLPKQNRSLNLST